MTSILLCEKSILIVEKGKMKRPLCAVTGKTCDFKGQNFCFCPKSDSKVPILEEYEWNKWEKEE